MADKKDNKSNSNGLVGRANNIIAMLNNISRKTYYANNDAKDALEVIRRNSDDAIDRIIDKTIDNNGTRIADLYTRVELKNGTKNKEVVKQMEALFEDKASMDSIMSTYMENKYIRNMDAEIDTILRYMPQLQEALDAKKDSILASDSFSKDFININSDTIIGKDNDLNRNVDEIKNTYKLSELFENAYDNISKYGEEFIYTVPYEKAISQIIKNTTNGKFQPYKDRTSIKTESVDVMFETSTIKNNTELITDVAGKITLNFNKSGFVDSILNESTAKETIKNALVKKGKGDDAFDFKSFSNTPDGIIDAGSKQPEIKVNGCVVKKLKRENVIPLYIDELCIGYYYIETDGKDLFDYIENIHDPFSGMKNNMKNATFSTNNIKDDIIKNLAKDISEKIDAEFINANQDLRKEIYLILKHNKLSQNQANNITVTYIPANEINHMYFKKDPKTNRGISDLMGAFIPAKLYVAIYISNVIGILTRSHDKRAYFVKQFVDTNISQSLMSVINQIKLSNFGRRELDNLDNIFNIAGKYNDFVIPTSQGGERPIEFEVIAGQEINTNDELMEKLEDMSIKTLNVPKEILDASQAVDFATRLVMSNAKFLRHVLKRQSRLEDLYSIVATRIYNAHYATNEEITITLPPPSHLHLGNINELWVSASTFIDGIIELEMTDKDAENASFEKTFRKNLMRYYLSTYVNWKMIESIKKRSILEAAIINGPTEAEEE